MSFAAIAPRRPVTRLSLEMLILGTAAASAAVAVGLFGLQSRHALLHEAVPILLVPLALWLFFSERYEVTLAVLLLYLGLADGVVKLASGSSVATLGRDVLLYAIVLGAVVRVIIRRKPVRLPPLTGLVIAWVAVCVMQVANPSDISLLHAVASLRQHLEFVPLLFFGYYLLRTKRRVAGLLLLLVIVGAANGIADLIQAHMSPSKLASWGPGYAGLELGTATRVARVFVNAAGQTRVRPPGLGGEDGFGGMVGLIALPGAVALLSSARHSLKMSWFLIPATMLTILGIVTSQTRLDVVGGAIALVAFIALTLRSRRSLAVLAATIFVGLMAYVIVSAFVSHSSNRYATIAPAKVFSTAVTERQSTLALLPTYMADYPLGAGLGTVGPASGSVLGGSKPPPLNGESEFTFLVVETGIPGLVVMSVFTITVIIAGLRMRRVIDPAMQRCMMALTAVVIALFATWVFTAATSDSPAAPFLWLTAGCLAYWHGEVRAGRIQVRPRLGRRVFAGR